MHSFLSISPHLSKHWAWVWLWNLSGYRWFEPHMLHIGESHVVHLIALDSLILLTNSTVSRHGTSRVRSLYSDPSDASAATSSTGGKELSVWFMSKPLTLTWPVLNSPFKMEIMSKPGNFFGLKRHCAKKTKKQKSVDWMVARPPSPSFSAALSSC